MTLIPAASASSAAIVPPGFWTEHTCKRVSEGFAARAVIFSFYGHLVHKLCKSSQLCATLNLDRRVTWVTDSQFSVMLVQGPALSRRRNVQVISSECDDVAIVTGAGSGIGRAVAEALAASGTADAAPAESLELERSTR